jgi:hypothetical protein
MRVVLNCWLERSQLYPLVGRSTVRIIRYGGHLPRCPLIGYKQSNRTNGTNYHALDYKKHCEPVSAGFELAFEQNARSYSDFGAYRCAKQPDTRRIYP